MVINQSQLKSTLAQHGINSDALQLLWEVDSQSIYGLTVAGSEAIEYWQKLRQLVDTTGHYPLLLGNRDEVDSHLETLKFYSQDSSIHESLTVAEIITQEDTFNIDEWLNNKAQEQWEEREGLWADDSNIMAMQSTLDPLTQAEIGEWNNLMPEQQEKYTIPYNILTRLPHPNIVVGMIPTTFSWQVPAFLKFGNWNDCPLPTIHVGLMKYWHQKYGAEVVGITHDVVEMCVNHPPQNREDTFRLAQEQYMYCSDIVEQGVQTLNNLAAMLLNRKVWYFWWD
ncbi:MAG: DUF4253 domain-containing protein [Aulosira sp. DedQUE10]|nr:DUF4253 domain-containing protein [Aulosira sp. DedQUE10]